MNENKDIQNNPQTDAAQSPSDKKIFIRALIKVGIISVIIIVALYFSPDANKQILIESFAYGLLCFVLNSFISLRRILLGLQVASSPAFFVSNSFFRMGLFGLMLAIGLKYLYLNIFLILVGFFLPFLFIIYEKVRELYRESKEIDKILK
jgi:hypothetical protein